MNLDFINYKKAVESLNQSLVVSEKLIHDEVNTPKEKVIRFGIIHNFEFTFELACNMMQRTLKEYFGNNDTLSRKELFRIAYKHELIENAEDWFKYQDARNITSQTYDENKADLVFAEAKKFSKDANYLLKKLEESFKTI